MGDSIQKYSRGLVLVALLLFRVAGADEVALLGTGLDSGQARLELIQGAKRGDELLLSTFIFGDAKDPVALTTLALLREAARRGVKVRILPDAFSNYIPKEMMSYLSGQENIEIKEFNPFSWKRPWAYTYRMHDKLLIRVPGDGGPAEMITGGRNVEKAYFNVAERHIRDADVYVRGQAAGESARYFREVWDSRYAVAPKAIESEALGNQAGLLDQALADIRRFRSLRLDGPGTWRERMREAESVRFVKNPIGGSHGGGHQEWLDLIHGAKRSIFIGNPYIIPTKAMKAALKAARARGVEITVITSDGGYNDTKIAQAGYEVDVPWLLKHGIKLHHSLHGSLFHEKTMVVDGEWSYVGTFNLSGHSQYYNTEEGVIVHDRRFAQDMMDDLRRDLRKSRPIRTAADALHLRGCVGSFFRLAARLAHEIL